MEHEIAEDLEHLTKTEKLDLITDNDELIDDVVAEMGHLTEDQIEVLREVVEEKESTVERLEELKKKQRERFNQNFVDHDYEKKLREQSDWYSKGRWQRGPEWR